MAFIDFAQSEITLTIVYFGPAGSGCGTNVRQLHRSQPARGQVELRRVGEQDRKDRIWHFTSVLDEPQIAGFTLRLRVASVPGQADTPLDRDAFLVGADGIVFVADARANRIEDNLTALHDLERCLIRQGVELASIPLVFQINQTDAPNARPLPRVMEELNPLGAPSQEAMARQGKGVIETFDIIRAAVLGRLQDSLAHAPQTLPLGALSRVRREQDEDAVLRHTASLPQATRPPPRTLGIPPAAEIVLRPPELRESEPIHVLRAELRSGRIRVEALVRRQDGSSRKLAFVIDQGGDPPTPVPVDGPITHATTTFRRPSTSTESGEHDLPSLAYGVVGVLSGLMSGYLLGYVMFG